MARRIRLEPRLNPAEVGRRYRPAEVGRRYRPAKDGTSRAWWRILWLLGRGQTAKAIAESTGSSRW